MANPKDKAKGFIDEFKAFISKGNVIDMAVGVIIATAFGKITTSLVNDVVMPAIGYFIGASDLSKLNIVLQEAVIVDGGETVPAVASGIGTFLSTIVDFLLVALVVFIFLKVLLGTKSKMEALRKKEEEEAAAAEEEAPAAPSAEEQLLTEIRALLKDQKNG